MRPIDTTILDRQTFGDRELRNEVLRLFVTQAQQIGESLLRPSSAAQRAFDLHRLKGSARAVGAVALGREIEAVERDLNDTAIDAAAPNADIWTACATLFEEITRACAQVNELLESA